MRQENQSSRVQSHGTDNRRTTRILSIFISLAIPALLGQPAYGGMGGVRWEDLQEHLSRMGRPLLDLNLCDCPADIQNKQPSREVAQVIENTFYAWEEYRITGNDNSEKTCIVMKQPQSAPLSVQEARILLTGSSLWLQPETAPVPVKEVDGNTIDLAFDATETTRGDKEGTLRIQDVFESDDRTRITDTKSVPWNTYCFIVTHFPSDPADVWRRGTGCLIGPCCVLTCGHMVYDQPNQQWADNGYVFPGQTQNYAGGLPLEPYDRQDRSEFWTNTSYTSEGGAKYDYGAVRLGCPISGINTYLPVVFDEPISTGTTVYIAGYPGTVKGGTLNEETNSLALWQGSGPITSVFDEEFYYTADTSEGDSGAPLQIQTSIFDTGRIIGVHSEGHWYGNVGARLTSGNKPMIQERMQWTPSTNCQGANASSPYPADGATWKDIESGWQVIRWTPGQNANWQYIHLNGQLIAQVAPTMEHWYLDRYGFASNQTYSWRIDTRDNGGTIHTGQVWSFTALRLKAYGPEPASGSTVYGDSVVVRWEKGETAKEHRFYLGLQSSNMTYRFTTSGTSGTITNLRSVPGQTLYWRVDTVESSGNVYTGDVWTLYIPW